MGCIVSMLLCLSPPLAPAKTHMLTTPTHAPMRRALSSGRKSLPASTYSQWGAPAVASWAWGVCQAQQGHMGSLGAHPLLAWGLP